MVRIKDGNYIAIFYDRMIEVKTDSKKKMLIIKQKDILNQVNIENYLMVNLKCVRYHL